MSGKQPGKYFDLLFPEDIMDNIQAESNRYAEQYLQKKEDYLEQHPHARENAYRGKPVTVNELKAFFAMLIMMVVISLPSSHRYWTSKWPFGLPSFSSIMSRNRFELILKFLHFNNNEHHIPCDQPGHDRLYKIRPFLSRIIDNLKTVYVPHQNLSADEA